MKLSPSEKVTSDNLVAAPLSADFLARIRAGASQRDTDRELPFEIVTEMKGLRFGARRLPLRAGGAGASLEQTLSEVIDLAEADSNVAQIWRNHAMLLERLSVHDSRAPILRHIEKRIAAGDMISVATTELNRAKTGGTSSFNTTLTPRGDDFVLSGRKFYSTGVMFAEWVVVSATLPDNSNVSAVLPVNREGVEVLDDWTGMGQRLTGTGTTVLNDVQVRADEILRAADFPNEAYLLSSTVAQLFLTAVIAGILEAIAKEATVLLASRKRTYYFAPAELAKDDPILLQALGEREADAFAARSVVLAAARVLDHASAAIDAESSPDGVDTALQEAAVAAARAKIVVDRLAHAAGSALYDVAGASSTLAEKNLDRFWRNLRTISSHNPASYKAFALGNRALNGVPLPKHGFF